MTEHSTFPLRGPPIAATTYHGQESNDALRVPGMSGGTADTPRYAKHCNTHSPHSEGARGAEDVAGLPYPPPEVQRSGSRRKAEEPLSPEKVMPTRKRRRRRKSTQVSFLAGYEGWSTT